MGEENGTSVSALHADNSANVTDLVDTPGPVVAILDEDGETTGAAARTARKQRHEEREMARLQRMSLRVAARRDISAKKDQKKQEEEARLLRVAQKAAARRAARAPDAKDQASPETEKGQESQETETSKEDPGKVGQAPGDTQQDKEPDNERSGEQDKKKEKQREKQKERRQREKEREKDREKQREQRLEKRRLERQREKNAKQEEQKAPDDESAKKQKKSSGKRGKDKPGKSPPCLEEPKPAPGREAQEAEAPKSGPAEAAGEGASSGGSESSSSSSSSLSSPSPTAMAIAKALATGAPIPTSAPSKAPCFAWERPIAPAPASGVPTPQSAIFAGPPVVVPLASSTELEQFLQAGGVDGEAAVRLRQLPPQLQRLVMDRGPVAGTRNPSSVVISRIKEVEAMRLGAPPGALGALGLGAPGLPPGFGGGNMTANPEIEALISKYALDTQASSMLRRLSPEQQRLALKLPIQEARNPSAFIMTQLSMPRLMGTGEASRLPTQPHDPTALMISGLLRF